MRLKKDFISQKLDDQLILVPVGKSSETFHGIVKNNETAGFIVECLNISLALAPSSAMRVPLSPSSFRLVHITCLCG